MTQDDIGDKELLSSALRVVPDSHVNGFVRPVVAIVDRNANFDQAAAAIVRSCSAFNGQSPYSPDLVLVNEFVKKDLLQALVKHTIALGNHFSSGSSQRNAASKQILQDTQRELNGDVITTGERGSIFEAQERTQRLLSRTSKGALITFQAVKSLDDGIDFVTS